MDKQKLKRYFTIGLAPILLFLIYIPIIAMFGHAALAQTLCYVWGGIVVVYLGAYAYLSQTNKIPMENGDEPPPPPSA